MNAKFCIALSSGLSFAVAAFGRRRLIPEIPVYFCISLGLAQYYRTGARVFGSTVRTNALLLHNVPFHEYYIVVTLTFVIVKKAAKWDSRENTLVGPQSCKSGNAKAQVVCSRCIQFCDLSKLNA